LGKGRPEGEGQVPLEGLSGGGEACHWAWGVVIGIQVCCKHRFLNPMRIPGNKIAPEAGANCPGPSRGNVPSAYCPKEAPSAPPNAPHRPTLSTEGTLHTFGWARVGPDPHMGQPNVYLLEGDP